MTSIGKTKRHTSTTQEEADTQNTHPDTKEIQQRKNLVGAYKMKK